MPPWHGQASRALAFSQMQSCDQPAPSGSSSLAARGIAGKLCRLPSKKVSFVDNNLTCPLWSSFASGGAASLTFDAAALAFWGCACPEGQFWGLTGADAPAAWEAERAGMTSDATLGQNESMLLQGRACTPCPSALACSRLAAVDAPHELVGSRYPVYSKAFVAAAARQGFPLTARNALVLADAFVDCLHPQVRCIWTPRLLRAPTLSLRARSGLQRPLCHGRPSSQLRRVRRAHSVAPGHG
jgi:hypothetical protein